MGFRIKHAIQLLRILVLGVVFFSATQFLSRDSLAHGFEAAFHSDTHSSNSDEKDCQQAGHRCFLVSFYFAHSSPDKLVLRIPSAAEKRALPLLRASSSREYDLLRPPSA